MRLSQFRGWIQKIMGTGRPRPVVSKHSRRTICRLEQLDDRLTPSAVSWTGGGDGTSWSDGRNWSDGVTPGAGDDVTINSTFATITLSGTDTVNSLTLLGGTLANSGNLTTNQGLTLSSTFATIANTGMLTVDGAFTWTDGTLSGTGTTILNGTSSLSGGFFSMLTNQQVDNNGTATITDGNSIDFDGNSVWNNEVGSTFTLQGNGSIGNFFAGASSGFNNFGTVDTNSPSETATIGVAFNNSGTVDVQAGTLNLSSGGTGSGTFTIEAGAVLSTNNYTLQNATVTGAGSLQVGTFNTLTVAGASTIQNLTLSSGTVTANAALDIQNLTLSGGTLTGPATITNDDTFTWTGGNLSGTGDTVLDGTLTLTGSFFSALGRQVDNYGTATVVAGTSVSFQDNAIWNNELGSTLILPDSASLSSFFSSGSAFNNFGTVDVTAPAGTSTIGIAFNNSGTVDVQAGTLNLSSGGTGSGTFTIEAGAILSSGNYTLQNATVSGDGTFQIGSFDALTIAGASSVQNLTVNGGTVNNNSTLEVQNLTLNSTFSTIANAGTLTVDDSFTWTDGTLSGTGTTILNGSSSLSGGFFSMLTNQQIDNNGTATISNGNSIDFDGNSVWNNEAGSTLILQGGGSIGNFFAGSSAAFNNFGTLEVTAPAGTSSIGIPLSNSGTIEIDTGTLSLSSDFSNAGTVTVDSGSSFTIPGNYTQTAGSTVVNGTLTASPTVTIDGGSLSGSGLIDANVSNAGEVSPGDAPAILTIDGSYTQTSSGTLNIEIDGITVGSGYSQLVVTGMASLAGTLHVTDPNNFLPNGGDTFQVLTFASSTGNFDTYSGLDLGNGGILQPEFAANDTGLNLVAYVTTTTTVTSNEADNTSVYGQDVTFNATVSAADGSIPAGSVQFQINGVDVGSPINLVAGAATFDAGILPAGSYQITVVYSGAGFDLGGTSTPLTYTVNPDPTTTTLTSSPSVTAVGQSVTFTATVAANAPGSGTPTGTVSFFDGSSLLDTVNLPTGGPDEVSFTTSALSVGNHTITAVYSGDSNFVTSTSTGTTEVILGPGVAVFGNSLYVVGADTADYVQINPVGTSGTGSAGLQVNSTLDGVWSSQTFSQPFTAIYIFGDNGNDTIQLGSSLTVNTFITEGNGNDYIQTANGNDVISLGSGSDQVFSGNGNKTITGQDTAGKNDYIQLGTGTDVVALGAGNDQVVFGNGNNSVTAGNGNDAVTAGNSNNTVTLGNGNEYIHTGNGANVVSLGNGSDDVQLGNGNNTVTLGNGTDYLSAGSGNNTVTVGNGNNDDVQVGGGNNVVVTGNGNNDYISAGNGDNLIAAGMGQHTVIAGNGSNILIDGAVTLTQSGDSLRQVLDDWMANGDTAANVASIRSRLQVSYNSSHANYLAAGSGLDWFWYTFAQDQTNMKPTDLLN